MVLHVIPIVQIIDEANRATLARATYCPVWSLAATMIQIS